MRREGAVPNHQLDAVIAATYASADQLNWGGLTPQERTRNYDRWLDEPTIGGVLTAYMNPEKARTWIKDGPMKEYAQARRGVGRYARFGRQGGTGPADVVVAALGPGAQTVPGTQKVKPSRCRAEDATGATAQVVWGEADNFKNLLWSALRTAVEERVPAHVVVLEPPGPPTPAPAVRVHRALADRCDVTLHYLTEVLGRLPDLDPGAGPEEGARQ